MSTILKIETRDDSVKSEHMRQIDHTKLTIAAATVAAELFHAEVIAKQLTISAKNAAAIVLRAGSQAAGLSVISSYYDELASKTITLARSINITAVQLSMVSVTEWRTSAVVTQVERARDMMDDPDAMRTVAQLGVKVEAELEHLSEGFQKLLKELYEQLDEVQRNMRAIDVIAVTSRLEAQQTGEFKEGLMQMANSIQGQASEIKNHVAKSVSLLNTYT